MSHDTENPWPPPPMPSPKRKNTVLRLFDAPLYGDVLFWIAIVWTVAAVGSSLSGNSSQSLPSSIVGALGAWAAFAIVPAWIRLHIRRKQWQRQQHSESAVQSERLILSWLGDLVTRWRSFRANRVRADEGKVATAAPPFTAQVHWERIDANSFERLLVRLLEQSGSYVRITRPMNVNAADAGRDIQAYRRVDDGLGSERLERTIVQAKHWPKRGVGPSEIADLVHAKLPLWEGEPVRALIVATTGSFTRDAVQWVEAHNRAGNRPDISLWSADEIEALLRKWPAVVTEFQLVD